jgi:predicted nucleic acid-binding protein
MSMVIDASIWVASFKADERDYETSVTFIQPVVRKGIEVYLPWLVLTECASAILRSTRNPASHADSLIERIKRFPNMTMVNVDEQLAHEAVAIVKTSGLRGADSIYAALAKTQNATLVAWDKAFFSEKLNEIVQTTDPAQWLAANG